VRALHKKVQKSAKIQWSFGLKSAGDSPVCESLGGGGGASVRLFFGKGHFPPPGKEKKKKKRPSFRGLWA